ncbi:hypothetical protein ACFL58_04895, partial [Elusimicrobiota bacterium]
TLSSELAKGVPYLILHHASKSNYDLQIVDYCNWGIFRKYESKDMRSYNIIKEAVKSEFDIFEVGTTKYY